MHKITIAAIGIGLSLLISTIADAAIIFDNIGTPAPSGGGARVTSLIWEAQSFIVGANNMDLTGVTTMIRSRPSPNGGFVVSLFSDRIVSNNTHIPNLSLETLSGAGNPSVGLNTYVASGSTLLTANTTYWIVYKTTSASEYRLESQSPPTTSIGSTFGTAVSSNGGSQWGSGGSSFSYFTRVSAEAAAVPEPSSILLVGGAATCGVLRRWRRRSTPLQGRKRGQV